jgi:hypothetical protein
MQTESEIIQYFKTLEHEEMLLILEYDEPGSGGIHLFTGDESYQHTDYFIIHDFTGLNKPTRRLKRITECLLASFP